MAVKKKNMKEFYGQKLVLDIMPMSSAHAQTTWDTWQEELHDIVWATILMELIGAPLSMTLTVLSQSLQLLSSYVKQSW